jgi:hypothetical protein
MNQKQSEMNIQGVPKILDADYKLASLNNVKKSCENPHKEG